MPSVLLLLFRLDGWTRVSASYGASSSLRHHVMDRGNRRARIAPGQSPGSLRRSTMCAFAASSARTPEPAGFNDRPRLALQSVWPVNELPAILREHVVDEIIFAVGSESLANLEEIFLLCDEEGVRTRVAVDFFPHVNSTISLDRFGETPLLTFSAAIFGRSTPLLAEAHVTDVLIAIAGIPRALAGDGHHRSC